VLDNVQERESKDLWKLGDILQQDLWKRGGMMESERIEAHGDERVRFEDASTKLGKK
jgi:hypothetical protein